MRKTSLVNKSSPLDFYKVRIVIIVVIIIIIIIILLLLLLLRGSVGTTWSTTSFGEQCRGPKFQQQRNHKVYYEVTASVQMVSRLYRGSKVNVLHGM